MAASGVAGQGLYQCKREIVETYGINSYSEPSKEPLVFCPNVRATCCPAYEQFKMFADYNSKLRPMFKMFDETIRGLLTELGKAVAPLFSTNLLAQQIAGIQNKNRKLQAEQLYAELTARNFTDFVARALTYQRGAGQYMAGLKSSFICSICDYNNQQFINIERKTVMFSEDSCDNLVENTIIYSNMVNRGIVPFLERLSVVFLKIRGSGNSISVAHHDSIRRAVRECAREFEKISTQLTSCRKYCSYFKMNSNSPVIEGYIDFFAHSLAEIRGGATGSGSTTGGAAAPAAAGAAPAAGAGAGAAATGGAAAATPAASGTAPAARPPGGSRVLSERTERIRDLSIGNPFDSFTAPRPRRHLKATKRVGRILQQAPAAPGPGNATWADDIDVLLAQKSSTKVDIFSAESENQEMDEAQLSEVVRIQEVLNEDGLTDLNAMVRQYYVNSYVAEIDDIDSDELFKMSYPIKVDLNEFSSNFGFNGINFQDILSKINWSITLSEIAKSLAGPSKAGRVDLIDQNLLRFLNNIGDEDVAEFHQNQYLAYKSYSARSTALLEDMVLAPLLDLGLLGANQTLVASPTALNSTNTTNLTNATSSSASANVTAAASKKKKKHKK